MKFGAKYMNEFQQAFSRCEGVWEDSVLCERLAMSKNDILNVWINQSLHDVDSLPVNTIKVIGSLNAIYISL